MRFTGCVLFLLCIFACESRKTYHILGNIEDPQNEIAVAVASILNQNLDDSIFVSPGIGSLANVDSLALGKADLTIVDNYSSYSHAVSSIMPVYGQILHILHKNNYSPLSLAELFEGKKIFAGIEGSGSWLFAHQLIADYEIKPSFEFVGANELFSADVIFVFTDLLSSDELQDLGGYIIYSLDDVENLGKGSLVEGICSRHPQFEPYIIAKNVYGNFTPSAILSVKVDALLVCRSSLSDEFVFNVIKQLNEHKQEIANINPLLYRFSGDFDPKDLSFELHSGARKYLSRYDPSFLEKNADLLGVVISILLAIASAVFSIARWQRMRKKNKIDIYYHKLIEFRNRISNAACLTEIVQVDEELKALQEETILLVTAEKLLADESFSIFLNLSRIISEEIKGKREAQLQ